MSKDNLITEGMDDLTNTIEIALSAVDTEETDITGISAVISHLRAEAERWRGIAVERDRTIAVLLEQLKR